MYRRSALSVFRGPVLDFRYFAKELTTEEIRSFSTLAHTTTTTTRKTTYNFWLLEALLAFRVFSSGQVSLKRCAHNVRQIHMAKGQRKTARVA